MNEPFRVGDIVECVDASVAPGCIIGPGLKVGGLYTVAGWTVHNWMHINAGAPAVVLKEMTALSGGWRPSRFRLIHRPRADFLTELLSTPVPEREAA